MALRKWIGLVLVAAFSACSTAPVNYVGEDAPRTAQFTPLRSARPVIGLVLGAGGSRGFAHVGVIKALCHWTFGLFWILWPQDNLQKAVPFYQPHIAAVAALLYVLVVACAWGPRRWRVGDSRAPGSAHPVLV